MMRYFFLYMRCFFHYDEARFSLYEVFFFTMMRHFFLYMRCFFHYDEALFSLYEVLFSL